MASPSSRQCSITVTEVPRTSTVQVVVAGEVDIEDRPLLSNALRRISAASPRTVVVDLALVTFAGSALARFLLEIREAVPAASLVLCRPRPMIRMVLCITGVTAVAVVRDDVPACEGSPAMIHSGQPW